jgi:cobalt-zinc-cadmium efflux system outer membrane protein
MVKVQAKSLLEAESEAASEVRRSFASLYAVGERIRLDRDALELLQQLEGVLEARYASAQAGQMQLVKLQVEMAKLEDRIRSAGAEAASVRAAMRALLGESGDDEIAFPGAAGDLGLPDSSTLVGVVVRESPTIARLRAARDAAAAGVVLQRQQFAPDLTLATDYVFTDPGGTAMVTPDEDGKDPWVVGAGVDIPLWAGSRAAGVAEARGAEAAAASAVEHGRNVVRARASGAVERYYDATRRAELLGGVLLPKAEQALSLAEEAYANSTAGILDFIDAQRTLLDLQVLLVQQHALQQMAAAELDQLAGGYFSGREPGSEERGP